MVGNARKSQAYFIVLSPRTSVTDAICLHFHFSVSRPGMEGIKSPFYFFLFICGLAMCLSREQSVGSSARADAFFFYFI